LHPVIPLTLTRLREAAEDTQLETAWTEFVAAHSGVVLQTCRAVARDYDVAMDAYAHVLQALREDGCRRLRAYAPDGRTQFTTWLVVVTRRLALDHLRSRYGRSRSAHEARQAEHASRRRLEDLVAEAIEPDELPGTSAYSPDAEIRRTELRRALRTALAHLEPDARLLLALKYVDERPVRDIARTLRLPSVFHVYRQLRTLLARLRASLAQDGIEGPEP
jgi:RNA polymerase sigma factor (sigma-70 family)